MEIRHMRSFIAVAEELNFRRAAERLQMAQPPLSQQIKRLERHVGVTLFHRDTRHVALTAAGQAFLAEARRALAAAHAAPQLARQAAAGQIGTVRLGFTGTGSYSVLLLIAQKFRQHRPRVQLSMVGPHYSGELVDQLHRQDADASLIRLPVASSGLRIHELAQDSFLAAIPADHPLAQRSALGIPDLCDQPIIGYPSHRGVSAITAIHSGFMKHGLSPNIVQEAPDMHTIMLLVGAGAGLGLVLRSAEHLKVPGVVLVPVPEIPPLPLALAWREADPNPALHALIELLDEVSTRLPNEP
jgi:DNA-binding transcriptional LysR family regulator